MDDDIVAARRFFGRLAQSENLPPDSSPVDAASAVLCALALTLTGGMAGELIRSLPQSLRALFSVCVRHRRETPVPRDRSQFLALVADHLRITEDAARRLALTVFAAIQDELPASAIVGVAAELPMDMRTLWPSHPKAA